MNEADLEVEIQIIGLKWFAFKVWIAEILLTIASRLVGYGNIKITHVEAAGEVEIAND